MRRFIVLSIVICLIFIDINAKKIFYDNNDIIPGLTIVSYDDCTFYPECEYFLNNVNNSDESGMPDPYSIIKISYDNLEQRITTSASRARKENAKILINGSFDLKENLAESNRILASNYVLKLSDCNKEICWDLYRIVTPKDAAELLLTTGGNTSTLELSYELIYSGKLKKKWSEAKKQEKFAKACPIFAPRGSVVKVSSHNTASRIGYKDIPMRNGTRFYAYSTRLNEKTMTPYSKKIGVLRAAKISEGSMRDLSNDSTLFFQIAGGKVHPGDILVYAPDHRMSSALSGIAQNNIYGICYNFDLLESISRMGFANYFMWNIGFKIVGKKINNWYEYQVEERELPEQNHPTNYPSNGNPQESRKEYYFTGDVNKIEGLMLPFINFGYGLGFNFWHCFEIRPYLMVGFELPVLSTDDTPLTPTDDMNIFRKNDNLTPKDYQDNLTGIFTGTLGCRFTLNIKYPFQFFAGAEYNYRVFANSVGKRIQNDILSPMDTDMGSGFSANAGFRWCF